MSHTLKKIKPLGRPFFRNVVLDLYKENHENFAQTTLSSNDGFETSKVNPSTFFRNNIAK